MYHVISYNFFLINQKLASLLFQTRSAELELTINALCPLSK